MKIALIGYGKMGKMVEEAALKRGHQIVAKIDSKEQLAAKDFQSAPVWIDFSHPHSVLDNMQVAANAGSNVVMGTTGWYDQLNEIQKIVQKHQLGFIYSPNFSLGVNLFLKIVSEAAALMENLPQYDVGVFEEHHNQKADAPSGTAKAIAKTLVDKLKRKDTIVHNLGDHPIKSNELQVSSLRCGSIPGTHTVLFDSGVDTITLTHQARNRAGFAEGAVLAAEWLQDKKGFFTIEDMLGGL